MINERVRTLRKELGLTLEKFGEKVGVSKSAINKIEKGITNVTEQMIKSICREFNVNEEWLRHGTGPMFKPASAKLSTYLGEISSGDDYLIQDLIEAYMELDQTNKEALRNFADKLLEKRNERNQCS